MESHIQNYRKTMSSSESEDEKEKTEKSDKILYTVDSLDSWKESLNQNIGCLSPSPCGRFLAVGTAGFTSIYDAIEGIRIARSRSPCKVRKIVWSSDAMHIAVSDNQTMILILTNRLELASSLQTSAKLVGFRGQADLLTCNVTFLRRHRMASKSKSSDEDTIDLSPWLEEIHCFSCISTSERRSRVAIGGRTRNLSKLEEELEITSSVVVFDVSDLKFIPCYHFHFDMSKKIILPILNVKSPRTITFATRISKLCRRRVLGTPIVCVTICEDNIAAFDKKGNVVVWNLRTKQRTFALVSSSTRALTWWSKNSLSILLSDGGLILASVCCDEKEEEEDQYHQSVNTISNRLGSSPEYFEKNSFISSRLVNREKMFILEENNNNNNNTQESTTLWSLSRATPRQVLISKLKDREYGSALALCRTYNMDRDIVFKHRWSDLLEDIERAKSSSSSSSPSNKEDEETLPRSLTRHHIKDILGKIKDIEFVTNQCSTNWPDTETSLRQLLEFGKRHVKNHASRFEQWLKRLSTYRAIRKAEKLQGDRTSSTFQVEVFKQEYKYVTIQDIARNMARSERLAAIEILLKRHAQDILPFRLDMILQHIPETTHPDQYAHLFPAFKPNKDLIFTSAEDSESDFENEWKEDEDEDEEETDTQKESSFFYWDLGRGAELVCEPFESTIKSDDRSKLAEWAIQRAKEIDIRSGLIRHAHALLRIARTRICVEGEDVIESTKVVEDLIQAERTAQELCYLLYECGVSDLTLSLEKWFDMSVSKRLEQVVHSDTDSLVNLLRNRVLPMMYQDNNNTSTSEWYDAVSQWLVKHVETRKGGLVQVSEIIIASRPTLPSENRLLRPISFLFRVALDCVYATRECDRDTLNAINEIFKSLPGRNAARDVDSEIHDRIDEMDAHLGASERLSSYVLFLCVCVCVCVCVFDLTWLLTHSLNSLTPLTQLTYSTHSTHLLKPLTTSITMNTTNQIR